MNCQELLVLTSGFCRNVFAPALSARSLLPTRSRPDNTITGIEESFRLLSISPGRESRHRRAGRDPGSPGRAYASSPPQYWPPRPHTNNIVMVCVEAELEARIAHQDRHPQPEFSSERWLDFSLEATVGDVISHFKSSHRSLDLHRFVCPSCLSEAQKTVGNGQAEVVRSELLHMLAELRQTRWPIISVPGGCV